MPNLSYNGIQFELDHRRVGISYTNTELTVGCHTVTREAFVELIDRMKGPWNLCMPNKNTTVIQSGDAGLGKK